MLRSFFERVLAASTAKPVGGIPTVEAKISDRYADVKLTNQFGQEVRFHRDLVAGRALVLNTMYTTCRGTCPTTSETITRLREKLSPVFAGKLSFVSLTLEPAVDTPAKLRKYADTYGASRPHKTLADWHFLTGSPEGVEKLRRSLGLYDLDPVIDKDITQHDAVLLFGNSIQDRWSRLPASQRDGILIEAIRRIAGFTFEQRYGIKG
jgi:protein SCO1